MKEAGQRASLPFPRLLRLRFPDEAGQRRHCLHRSRIIGTGEPSRLGGAVNREIGSLVRAKLSIDSCFHRPIGVVCCLKTKATDKGYPMQLSHSDKYEAAILARVLHPEQDDLPAAAARALLRLGFDQYDRDRMHDLAVKNQADELTEGERLELESYRRVGRLIDLLCARAEHSLAKHNRDA